MNDIFTLNRKKNLFFIGIKLKFDIIKLKFI